MPDLITFLKARLDEDEAAARAASTAEPWRDDDGCVYADGEILHREGMDLGDQAARIAEHVVRWQPVRVLAEVEAMRRMVEAHSPAPEGYLQHRDGHACRSCKSDRIIGGRRESLPVAVPCGTLRLLALPHAAHPDCDPTWATDTPPTSA